MVATFLLLLAGDISAWSLKASAKLPSPEKIVRDYLKAIGGQKRVAAVKDATYEYAVIGDGAESTATRVQMKSPGSLRTDSFTQGGEVNRAASPRSAWTRDANGDLRTLTDAAAQSAKLQAALEASNLLDFKKRSVLARTVMLDFSSGEGAYVVEFSTREGARLRYWFGATSKLILKLADLRQETETTFADYKAREGIVEPHRVSISLSSKEPPSVFQLRNAHYNTGLPDSIFDPPSDQAINIPQLLRDVSKNQKELDERISEYTYSRKQVEREINDRGELKREKVIVHEIYPLLGGGRVLKLISEDGAALSTEKTEKEEKRVAEELAKGERDYQKKQQEKRERAKRKSNESGMGKDGDDDFEGVSAFLRVCEFVSPRRELFRGRQTIVFDFRPKASYKPRNREETLISKLIGVAWIDPEDQQVMRMEARLADGFKVGGGLLASVRSGSAFVFEQARMADGVWLPRFSQINASVKVLLFAGIKLDATREYSDYKKFNVQTGEASVQAEKELKP
ncbi:MAG: hypothetical protein WKF84_24055 [Pyrinomonadaceae bacterium]